MRLNDTVDAVADLAPFVLGIVYAAAIILGVISNNKMDEAKLQLDKVQSSRLNMTIERIDDLADRVQALESREASR